MGDLETLTRPAALAVASANPVKIATIEGAFTQHFPGQPYHMEGCAVASGVPDQPMSDEETRRGAENRLTAVRDRLPEADLWAGLEGGIQILDDGSWHAFAWIVVATRKRYGAARTATFPLPDCLTTRIREGMELGAASDDAFGRENAKQREGAIGILSSGMVDRRALYVHAAVMAMIPLKHEAWS